MPGEVLPVVDSDASSTNGIVDQDSLGDERLVRLVEDIKDTNLGIRQDEAQIQEVQEAIADLKRSVCAADDELTRNAEIRRELENECALLQEQCATAEATLKRLEEDAAAFQTSHDEKELETQSKVIATEADLTSKLATVASATQEALSTKQELLRSAEEEHARQLQEQKLQSSEMESLTARLSEVYKQVAEAREEREAGKDCTASVQQDVSRLSAELSGCEQIVSALQSEVAQKQNSLEALQEESRSLARKTVELRSMLEGTAGSPSNDVKVDQGLEDEKEAVSMLTHELLEARGYEDDPHATDDVEMMKFAASDEERLLLLREQVKFIEHQEQAARKEMRDLEGAKDDLAGKSAELKIELEHMDSFLADKQDNAHVQFADIEQLQIEISQLQDDSELLTLGLHEAELLGENLKKESVLMHQQVEGLYSGTLQDWQTEVRRLKDAAALDKYTGELEHWRKVAQEAEREMAKQVADVNAAHEQAMVQMKQEISSLSEMQRRQEERLRSATQEAERMKAATREVANVAHASHGMISGSVPSVPTAIVHNISTAIQWLAAPTQPLPKHASHRRALIVGCNYYNTGMPLKGCMNDIWNMQCILRHSLQYGEDQVRCLTDSAEPCPSPANQQPTLANLLEGLRWLTTDAGPTSTLFIYFSGYGCTQPTLPQGVWEAYFVPCDFLEDMPAEYVRTLHAAGRSQKPNAFTGLKPPPQSSYRLLALRELTNVLLRLPAGCKVTLVLDCSCAAVAGVVASSSTAYTPMPMQSPDLGGPRKPALANVPTATMGAGTAADAEISQLLSCRTRLLDLPPVQMPPMLFTPGALHCQCFCYSACQAQQTSAEFPIEGCVQGAFTWAFVKALTAGHLKTTVHQHSAAMLSILSDLHRHFKWLEQTPAIELSPSAGQRDYVLVRGPDPS